MFSLYDKMLSGRKSVKDFKGVRGKGECTLQAAYTKHLGEEEVDELRAGERDGEISRAGIISTSGSEGSRTRKGGWTLCELL